MYKTMNLQNLFEESIPKQATFFSKLKIGTLDKREQQTFAKRPETLN